MSVREEDVWRVAGGIRDLRTPAGDGSQVRVLDVASREVIGVRPRPPKRPAVPANEAAQIDLSGAQDAEIVITQIRATDGHEHGRSVLRRGDARVRRRSPEQPRPVRVRRSDVVVRERADHEDLRSRHHRYDEPMPQEPLHDYVSRGFGTTTALYERVRPEYPAEGIDILVRALGIRPGTVVLDVGAGTGKLTRALVPTGATLIAVEPLAEMRERLAENVPRAVPFAGTAEDMALRDGAAHAITVAQAFHWFDGDRALAEFHRVLAPGGRLGLIWNVRDRRVPWVASFDALVDAVDPDRPDHQNGKWRAALERSTQFGPLTQRDVESAQTLSPAEIVERAATVSSIAALDHPERERILDRFRELAATHPDIRGHERVRLPYITKIYWTERR